MSGDEPIFPPSLGQPGSEVIYYPSPLTHKLASSSSSSQDGKISFRVDVPPASLPHIFAHRQWRAGMILADLIAASSSPQGFIRAHIKDRTVLELGCGTALPALVAAHPALGGAAFTVATDYNEAGLIRALKANVARNHHLKDNSERTSSAMIMMRIKAAGYTWGTSPDDIFDLIPRTISSSTTSTRSQFSINSSFETILLADTLWDPLSHSDLAKSLGQILAKKEEARVVVVAGLHTGRERILEFVGKASRVGLEVCPLHSNSSSIPSSSSSGSLWDELELVKEEELDAKLAARNQDDIQADAWTEHVLEFELAKEEHEDEDGDNGERQQQQASATTSSATDIPVRIESRGPRLTGRRRRFVSRESWRPEEAKERGGIKLRNRWMTVWTLRWSTFAL